MKAFQSRNQALKNGNEFKTGLEQSYRGLHKFWVLNEHSKILKSRDWVLRSPNQVWLSPV